MKNDFGLDAPYFKKNLEKLIRDIDSYAPDEMSRALRVLSETACEHRFMYFGDKVRRCADCNVLEKGPTK